MESQKVDGTAAAGQKGKGKVFKTASFLGAAVIGGSLIGGGTLALWNDTIATDSYDIQAGTMAIEQVGEMELTDIGGGFSNSNTLDKDNFQASPGQRVQVQQQFDIALDGTDLYAAVDTQELGAALTDVSGLTGPEGESLVTVSDATFTDADGDALTSDGDEYHFFSADNTTRDTYEQQTASLANSTAAGTTIDGVPELVVTYEVEFSDQIQNLEGAGETLAALEAVDLSLNQRATW